MVRKSTTIALTTMLVATGLLMGACSGDDDDDNPGSGGGSGTGATAGKGGTGNAGTGTGGTTPTAGMGTGGNTPTAGKAGSGGTGGASTGGSGGAAAGSGGAGGKQGYACAGKMATCNSITEFSTSTAASFGMGVFTGGVTIFGTTATGTTTPAYARVETTDTSKIHVTGTVTGYGFGFGLWFAACSDLSAFTGVEFTIGGTTMAATPNVIQLQVQTNSDYPWQADLNTPKGGCTAMDTTNPWGECIAPVASVTMMPTPTAMPVLWAGVSGGTPVMWSATTSPMEVIGIQWQFPWDETTMPYVVDATLESVKLTGGTDTACPTISGMGGMGGMGGMAGSSSGGAGAGGMASGGMAGSATGGGGASAGSAGRAGASGSAGRSGGGGMGGNN
jgi:hypothetical protein